MKQIKILIAGAGWKPLGGLKILYEYANRLAQDDFQISFIYSAYCNIGQYDIFMKIKCVIKYLYFRFIRDYTSRKWFHLTDNIKTRWVWALTEKKVGEADIYIATALETSYYLANYHVPKTKKIYFVQDFENWGKNISDTMVLNSYHLPLCKITISEWLKHIIENENETTEIVPNGFDTNLFFKYKQADERVPYSICMMYNTKETKGCTDCFKALSIVKNKYPQLKVYIFGIPNRPSFLPQWYHYYKQPNKELLRTLYNDSMIYIGASHSEGWGLTIGEAMLCGCAIACTDNLGYQEMAKDEYTALLSPIKNPQLLAENIIKLLDNPALRNQLAENAHKFIQQFTMDKSYIRMKKIIDRC